MIVEGVAMKYSKEQIDSLSAEEIKKLKEELDAIAGKSKLSEIAQTIVSKENVDRVSIKQKIEESIA
jgi:replicative DNA helicase